MFLYYLLGSFLVLAAVAFKPRWAYRLCQLFEKRFRPKDDRDTQRLLVYLIVLYYGVLFPFVLMLEIIWTALFSG